MYILLTHIDENGDMPVPAQVSNVCSAEQGLGAGSNGTVSATGGGNMDLSTVLVLCERADDDPYRVFDGRYPNSLTIPSTLSGVSCPSLALESAPSTVYLPESEAEQPISPCQHHFGSLLFTHYLQL